MSENLRKYINAVYLLDAVAQRVAAGAWDNPSCCEGWTAREVAGHAGWLIKNIGNMAATGESIAEQAEAEVLGDDPAAGFRAIAHRTLEQLDQQGVLHRVTDNPWGTMPVDRFLGIVWVDPMTHAWDLADATGVAHGIDEATAQMALDQMTPASDMIRGPGRFDAVVETDATDAVSRFIAFTGRSSVNG